jgi:23S rRNA pseudouridine2605 synthase
MKERAQKVIAQSGLMSRRKAEEVIAEGRVALNGVVFTQMGQTVDPEVDVLTVDGKKIELKTHKRTFLFYKPRGIVTTKSDEMGRSTVMDFFKDQPSVNPVGRLDADSEGLLLMTEDGDLLLKLTHPRYGVKKVYEVDVTPARIGASVGGFVNAPTANFFAGVRAKLLTGIALEDGVGKFDSIVELKPGTYRVTVSEGRNRFIRRMFQALDLSVSRLKRLSMGEYQLGDLKPGDRKEV